MKRKNLVNRNFPMSCASELKWSTGKSANGSWTDCNTLIHWSTLLFKFGSRLVYTAMATAGPREIKRVIRVRSHSGILQSRKPSITNCPAIVPVIVEACPAASNPKANMVLPISPCPPNSLRSVSPASAKPISPQMPCVPAPVTQVMLSPSKVDRSLCGKQAKGPFSNLAHVVLKKPVAKVETNAALITKEMARATAESTALYLLACFTCSGSDLLHVPHQKRRFKKQFNSWRFFVVGFSEKFLCRAVFSSKKIRTWVSDALCKSHYGGTSCVAWSPHQLCQPIGALHSLHIQKESRGEKVQQRVA